MLKKTVVLALALAFTTNAHAKDKILPVTGKMCALTLSMPFQKIVTDSRSFQGVFLGSEIVEHETNGLLTRRLSFEVTDPINGVEKKGKLTLDEFAAIRTPFSDDKLVGKKCVFNFHPDSKIGFTSSKGHEQGIICPDENGVPQISARVLNESQGLFGSINKSRTLGILASTTADKSPKNYDELKSLYQDILNK